MAVHVQLLIAELFDIGKWRYKDSLAEKLYKI